MKTLSLIVGIVLSAASVGWAAPGEDALDWTSDDYEAIPFTGQDVVALATIAGSSYALSSTGTTMAQAAPIAAFLGWGAWRTNKYRAEVSRAQVAENIRKEAALPKPGTVQHTLECDGTNC